MQNPDIQLTANMINFFLEGMTLGKGVGGMKDSGCTVQAILKLNLKRDLIMHTEIPNKIGN